LADCIGLCCVADRSRNQRKEEAEVNIIVIDWLLLTSGERLAVLSYAADLNKQRWVKRKTA